MAVLAYCLATLVAAVSVRAPASVVRTGWLDRVVEYQKQKFIEDVQKNLPPIEFKVKLAKAPPGYVDSKDWDYDSVTRLLTLLHESEQAQPVARALRRMMYAPDIEPDINPNNTRRIFMSKQDSYKFFPKLGSGNVYYADDYEEMGPLPEENQVANGAPGLPGDYDTDAIVIISNPVESRLPSSHISVGMLKEILETRALAARIMPTHANPTIFWPAMNTTTEGVENTTTTGGLGNTTIGGGATTGGGAAGNDTGGGATTVDAVDPAAAASTDTTLRRRNPPIGVGFGRSGKISVPNTHSDKEKHLASKTVKRKPTSVNVRRFRIFKTKRAMAKHSPPPPILNKEKVDEVVRRTIAKQQKARAKQHARAHHGK